jgi:hypothetical protein
MAEFLNVALVYPTLPYSILLGFSAVYWLLAATGLVDHGFDGGDLHHLSDDGLHGVSGMFARLGLGGAPVMLVIALLALFGWSCTYFVHLLLLQHLPTPLRWRLGTLTAVAALLPAVPLSAWVLRPIRRLLLKLRAVPQQSLLGKVGVVASPDVTALAGHANVDDGGAGLVLQVRASDDARHVRGQRVVLVDYDATANTYRVVSAQEHPAISFSQSPEPGDKEIHR